MNNSLNSSNNYLELSGKTQEVPSQRRESIIQRVYYRVKPYKRCICYGLLIFILIGIIIILMLTLKKKQVEPQPKIQMEYFSLCDNSKLNCRNISRLIMGTGSLGNYESNETAKNEYLNATIEMGINTFDTAPILSLIHI